MLDRLIDVLVEFIGLFQIWFYIDEYEEGIVLRCGKFNRVVKPGFRWILPFSVEEVLVDNVVPTTTALGVQSLHTLDDKHINIECVLLWKITDIRKVLLEVEDADDVLVDISTGCIAEMVTSNNWDYIRSPEFVKELKKLIQTRAKYGIKIMNVYISDCSKTRAIRMWHEGL